MRDEQGPDLLPDPVRGGASIATEPVPACPGCGNPGRVTARGGLRDQACGVPGEWSFARCSGCGLVYLDPRPAVPAQAYPGVYPQHGAPALSPVGGPRLRDGVRAWLLSAYGYAPAGGPARGHALGRQLLRAPLLRARAFCDFLLLPPPVSGGRLLDVGCGNGRFVAFAQQLGWNVAGVEPDPRSAEQARQATGAPVHATLADAAAAGPFDVVTLNHVLEHATDPVALLRECAAAMGPGSRLGVCVPNWTSLSHRAFGEHWHALEPSRHLVMFTRGTLRDVLRRAGFRVDSLAATSVRETRVTLPRAWARRFGRDAPAGLGLAWWMGAAVATALVPALGEEVIAWARLPGEGGAADRSRGG